MKIANQIIRNIIGDKISKNKILETREESIITSLKKQIPNISDSDAKSMAKGLLNGSIPFIDTSVGRIEVK